MNKINIQTITNRHEFKNMRSQWNDLLNASHTVSLFMTWEWLYSWWSAYSNNKKLYIICARGHNNELLGIAPLFMRQTIYYKVPVTELTFIGDSASDRQDFIVDKRYPDVYAKMVSLLLKHPNWDICRLEQVPDSSALLSHTGFQNRCQTEYASSLPFIDISTDWDTYFRTLSKKFKKDLRNKYNILKKEGEYKFIHFTAFQDIDALLKKLFMLETNSKKMQAGYALFADLKAQQFHTIFSRYSTAKKWLAISYLLVNDTPIAYLMGYIYDSKYLSYNIAYLPKYHRASPGKLILHETLKYCFQKELYEFDFLRGETYIKHLWKAKNRTNYRVVLFNRTIRARLLRIAIFKIRPIIKHNLSKFNKPPSADRMSSSA